MRERLAGLEIARRDFQERAEARGAAFVAQHVELIEQIEGYFEGYAQALLALQRGSTPPVQSQLLLFGVDSLKEHTGPLLECMQRYGQLYLGAGSSRFPLLNLIDSLEEGLRQGHLQVNQVTEALAESRRPYEVTLTTIDATDSKSACLESKAQALDDLLTALEESEGEVRAGRGIRREVIEAALERLEQAEEGLARAQFMEGPTQSPPANVLLQCVRGGLNGVQPLSVVRDALTWYQAFKARLEAEFDEAITAKTESVVILEELPKARAIMDRHEEALDQLESALEDFTLERVEPILLDFERTVEDLHRSSEVFLSAVRREAEISCPQCERVNPRVNRRCEACGASLPQIPGAATGTATSSYDFKERLEGRDPDQEDGVVTENTYKIFEACYKFSEGQITAEQLLAVVQWSRERWQISQNNVGTLPLEVVTNEELEKLDESDREAHLETARLYGETRELMIEALEDWAEGLDLLEEYSQTRARPCAELAARRIWDSSQQMLKVQKLGELADKQLKELEIPAPVSPTEPEDSSQD